MRLQALLAILLSGLVACASAAPARGFSLCTSDTPFPPLSRTDPQRPGSSQLLIGMVAQRLGLTITHVVAPWRRCQLLLERGVYDALNITGYAGANKTIAVFPMKDGLADPARALGTVPMRLYRRVGSAVDLVDGRIVGTDRPVAVLQARQVSLDAVERAGARGDDSAKTVDALVGKLLSGQVDLAASAEQEFADQVAGPLAGQLQALPRPLVESHYYLVFSQRFHAAQPALAEEVWAALAAVRASAEYQQRLAGLR